MRIEKKCYCLLAVMAGISAILLKTCCLEDYPPSRWDATNWTAAIGMTMLFATAGLLGCRHSLTTSKEKGSEDRITRHDGQDSESDCDQRKA